MRQCQVQYRLLDGQHHYTFIVPGHITEDRELYSLATRLVFGLPGTWEPGTASWDPILNQVVVTVTTNGELSDERKVSVLNEMRRTVRKAGTAVPETLDPHVDLNFGPVESEAHSGVQNNEEPFDDDDSCVPIGFTPARDDLTEWNVYSTHLELPEDFLYKGYETTVTCVHEPSAQQCDTFMIHLSDKFQGRFMYKWVPLEGYMIVQIDSFWHLEGEWEDDIKSAAEEAFAPANNGNGQHDAARPNTPVSHGYATYTPSDSLDSGLATPPTPTRFTHLLTIGADDLFFLPEAMASAILPLLEERYAEQVKLSTLSPASTANFSAMWEPRRSPSARARAAQVGMHYGGVVYTTNVVGPEGSTQLAQTDSMGVGDSRDQQNDATGAPSGKAREGNNQADSAGGVASAIHGPGCRWL